MNRINSGFTLVEVIVVATIVGMMSSIAVISFSQMRIDVEEKDLLDTDVHTVRTSIRRAQHHTLYTNWKRDSSNLLDDEYNQGHIDFELRSDETLCEIGIDLDQESIQPIYEVAVNDHDCESGFFRNQRSYGQPQTLSNSEFVTSQKILYTLPFAQLNTNSPIVIEVQLTEGTQLSQRIILNSSGMLIRD